MANPQNWKKPTTTEKIITVLVYSFFLSPVIYVLFKALSHPRSLINEFVDIAIGLTIFIIACWCISYVGLLFGKNKKKKETICHRK